MTDIFFNSVLFVFFNIVAEAQQKEFILKQPHLNVF